MGIFNQKTFNSEVFGKYLETVPRVKQNAFLTAGILRPRADLKARLVEQTGGNFMTEPMTGLIGGTPDNYDGSTDISADALGTYTRSMIVVGRAHAWTEKDFTYDITGHNFMEEIAKQVGNYWDDVDQDTILAILEGIFQVTDNGFATKHTYDISADTDNKVGATTLNSAIQKAGGANKNIFKMCIMHSEVATNLENLRLLDYMKYTDENGIERDLALATWNGRTVLIDDDVPVDTSGDTPKYTTYVLGEGAFDYCDCGAKVPNETWRDPKTNGGEEYLYTRQRKLFHPKGFTFNQPSTPIISPTRAELATRARWSVVKDDTSSKYFDSKAIPFVKIVSLG